MTDPTHLQAALERLEKDCRVGEMLPVISDIEVRVSDLRLILTSHAALLARAEAAEAALLPLATLFDPGGAMTVSFSDTIGKWFTMADLQDAYFAYRAAHSQPQAPVMGGEKADA